MKLTVNLKLPKDFQHVCEIFGYQPEEVLQRFIDEVSFPEFFNDPNSDQRWATLFFLHNMGAGDGELADQWEQHKSYIDEMAATVINNPKKTAEKACRKIMKRWHKSMVATERTE